MAENKPAMKMELPTYRSFFFGGGGGSLILIFLIELLTLKNYWFAEIIYIFMHALPQICFYFLISFDEQDFKIFVKKGVLFKD